MKNRFDFAENSIRDFILRTTNGTTKHLRVDKLTKRQAQAELM